MSKPHQLVLFDIDGTLLRGAGPHHKAALIEGIRAATGLATNFDGIPTAGMLDRDLIRHLLRASGCSQRRASTCLPRIVEEVQRAYLRNCAKDLRQSVCAGVPDFLESLRRNNIAIGLVTGNLTCIGWKKVEVAGLGRFFQVGAFSEDGATRADLARIAAKRALSRQLITTGSLVALIGDHPNDVAAAKANGFRSIAVATGFTSAADLRASEPDILVEDLRALEPDQLWTS